MSLSWPGPQAVRKLAPGRLVIASHNPGKVREIAALLAPHGVEPVSAADLDLPEPEETGTTFTANAELKAMQAADLSGLPALADDSGLVAEALIDQPGLHSARWSEIGFTAEVYKGYTSATLPGTDRERDFLLAMKRLHYALENLPEDIDRSAHFVCALALAWPDGHSESWEGRVDGHLVWPPRGGNGFGYDPMFVAEGETRTYGELSPEEKHADNHRARAFAELVRDAF